MVGYYLFYCIGTVTGVNTESNSQKVSGGKAKGVEYPDDRSDHLFPVFAISDNISGHTTLYASPYCQ